MVDRCLNIFDDALVETIYAKYLTLGKTQSISNNRLAAVSEVIPVVS